MQKVDAFNSVMSLFYVNEISGLADMTFGINRTIGLVSLKKLLELGLDNCLANSVTTVAGEADAEAAAIGLLLANTEYVDLHRAYGGLIVSTRMVYEKWPLPVFMEFWSAGVVNNGMVSKLYADYAVQCDQFNRVCMIRSENIGSELSKREAPEAILYDMVYYYWQFKMARFVLLESMGWAMVCNYARRDRDFQGLEKMEGIALKALAVRVRRMEELLGSLKANSRSPQPFIKGDFIPVFRERVVQWRAALDAALDAALASDGLVLPGEKTQ